MRKHQRRAYARIPTSILREPWSSELKLSIMLLQLHMVDRWARDGLEFEESTRCVLDLGTLYTITNNRRADTAMRLASKWPEIVSLSVEFLRRDEIGDWPEVRRKSARSWPEVGRKLAGIRPEFVAIEWPKFAIFQDFPRRGAPLSAAAPAAAPAPAKQTEKKPRARAPKKRSTGNGQVKCPAVEDWGFDTCTRLMDNTGVSREMLFHAIDRAYSRNHDESGTPNARQLRTIRGWEDMVRNGLKAGWLKDGFNERSGKTSARDVTGNVGVAQAILQGKRK